MPDQLNPADVQRYLSPAQFGLWQAMQQVYGGGAIGNLRQGHAPVGLPPGAPPMVMGDLGRGVRGQQSLGAQLPFRVPQSWATSPVMALNQDLSPEQMAPTVRHESIHSEQGFWDRVASMIGVGPTSPWSKQASERYGSSIEPLAYAGSNTVWSQDRPPGAQEGGEMVPEAYAYVAQALQSMPQKKRSRVLGYLDPAVRARVEPMLAEGEK